MSKFGITPGLVRGRVEQFEQKIRNGATNPAQPRQSPAARSPGAQLEGLSNFTPPDGASPGAPRRSALPGQARGPGAQMAGSALHAASHFMPPGLASIGTHAVGDMLMSPMIGNGAIGDDAVADAEAQSDQSIRNASAMADIDNRAKVAKMLINRQSNEISELTSIGNKGSADAQKAATGQ